MDFVVVEDYKILTVPGAQVTIATILAQGGGAGGIGQPPLDFRKQLTGD